MSNTTTLAALLASYLLIAVFAGNATSAQLRRCSAFDPSPAKAQTLMKYYDNFSVPIYFWHIQKAGGSSFCQMMRHTYHKVLGFKDGLGAMNCNSEKFNKNLVTNFSSTWPDLRPKGHYYVATEPSLDEWLMEDDGVWNPAHFPLEYHDSPSAQVLLNASYGAQRDLAWKNMVHVLVIRHPLELALSAINYVFGGSELSIADQCKRRRGLNINACMLEAIKVVESPADRELQAFYDGYESRKKNSYNNSGNRSSPKDTKPGWRPPRPTQAPTIKQTQKQPTTKKSNMTTTTKEQASGAQATGAVAAAGAVAGGASVSKNGDTKTGGAVGKSSKQTTTANSSGVPSSTTKQPSPLSSPPPNNASATATPASLPKKSATTSTTPQNHNQNQTQQQQQQQQQTSPSAATHRKLSSSSSSFSSSSSSSSSPSSATGTTASSTTATTATTTAIVIDNSDANHAYDEQQQQATSQSQWWWNKLAQSQSQWWWNKLSQSQSQWWWNKLSLTSSSRSLTSIFGGGGGSTNKKKNSTKKEATTPDDEHNNNKKSSSSPLSSSSSFSGGATGTAATATAAAAKNVSGKPGASAAVVNTSSSSTSTNTTKPRPKKTYIYPKSGNRIFDLMQTHRIRTQVLGNYSISMLSLNNDIEEAKKNIRKFSLVLDLSFNSISTTLMRCTLGWDHLKRTEVYNHNIDSPSLRFLDELSEDVVHRMMHHLRYEIALYDYAVGLMMEHYSRATQELYFKN